MSTSQEGPPVPASPEPTPSEKLVEEKAPDVVMAVDKSHARREQSILDRVIRFGNFFGSAKDEDARHPDYLIRWVNSLRMEEGGNFKYRTSARASFVLPKISNRLRLTVSGETTEIELSHQFGPKTLLRWANAWTITEESPREEWAGGVQKLVEV